jgi:hypothetical protein
MNQKNFSLRNLFGRPHLCGPVLVAPAVLPPANFVLPRASGSRLLVTIGASHPHVA